MTHQIMQKIFQKLLQRQFMRNLSNFDLHHPPLNPIHTGRGGGGGEVFYTSSPVNGSEL